MPGNKKSNTRRDLTWASEAMRNENSTKQERSVAAQDMANRRWEQEYKRQLSGKRSSSRSMSGRR